MNYVCLICYYNMYLLNKILEIHDMAGNVYEFCLDGKNNLRTCRGGGWSSQKESLRVSFKNGCR